MGFLSDIFGGGAKKARKEKDYWQAQAVQMTTYAHGLAAENQARIKMASDIAAKNKAAEKAYKDQARAQSNKIAGMRAAHNRTIRTANRRMQQQRATFQRQAKEAKIAREKFSFAMENVDKRAVKTARLKTTREGVRTPSVTGTSKKAAGSLLTKTQKPLRRAVGGTASNKGRRRRGGTNTRRPR